MSEKVICEKCGAEMQYFQRYGSCGMTCPVCGWGWATTYTAPIDQDETEYILTVPSSDTPGLSAIKCVSKLSGYNFIETRKLLQESGYSKSGKARIIRECAAALHKDGISFTIAPEFPYDLA